jgi:hypothetical protein
LLLSQIHALELIAAAAPLGEILESLALTVEQQSGGESVVSIFLVDPTGKRLRVGAAPSLPEEFNRAVDGIEIKAGLGTCADAAARATMAITPDIAAAAGARGSSRRGRCRSCRRPDACSEPLARIFASGAAPPSANDRSWTC